MNMTKNQEYKEENSIRCTLRFYRTTGVPDALETMQKNTGMAWTMYAKKAVIDALVRDGYMPENSEDKGD